MTFMDADSEIQKFPSPKKKLKVELKDEPEPDLVSFKNVQITQIEPQKTRLSKASSEINISCLKEV